MLVLLNHVAGADIFPLCTVAVVILVTFALHIVVGIVQAGYITNPFSTIAQLPAFTILPHKVAHVVVIALTVVVPAHHITAGVLLVVKHSSSP